MIFGFLLAVCFDPYILNAATTPRWCLLAIALPVLIWRTFESPNHFTLIDFTGLAFLTWCIASLYWTPNLPDAFASLIRLLIVAEAYVLGARLNTLEPIMKGMALGLAISSLIIVTRYTLPGYIATDTQGLLGNRNMLAEAAVLTLCGLTWRNRYLAIGLLPSIFMPPMARGALLGLFAAGLTYLWSRSRKLTISLALLSICAALILIKARPSSVIERMDIWADTIRGLTFWGHGIGSFQSLYPFLNSHSDGAVAVVDHPHNEILEIAFNLGFIGLGLFALLVALALGSAADNARYILVAWLVIGCFAYPTAIPCTAFLAALALGHASRAGAGICWNTMRRRVFLRSRHEHTYGSP